MNIILGSGSKSRRRVLERAGCQFKVMVADIDEKAIRFDDPKKLVLALANAKADALLPRIKEEAVLITADQVVVCNGEMREKPVNEAQAREYLHSYSKYPVEVVNGIVLINTKTGERSERLDISKIKFKLISEQIIDELIRQRNIFSQAGGLSVEDPLNSLYIDYIEGSLDSIKGLPIEIVKDFLNKQG